MNNKLVAILRGITPSQASEHVEALINHGFQYIEIPLNSPDWHRSIGESLVSYGDNAVIGAGTVLRLDQVDALAELGVRFIVTPNTNPALIRHARQAGMLVCSGFATPSEAFSALEAGADWLKLFPAATFGTGYIRAIRAVLPSEQPLLAVGGVTPDTLQDYLAAGCNGAGLGSDLYRAGQPVQRTIQQAQAFMAAWRNASS
ncbi:2-dehydro-3-deoxy-6-phosphogalactonate aldolase [Salmonella enterica subsp. enterica serovar Choleraesuis]|nr:2-dehydro-3-deoxy-6-phosphogalactonate aldolase [Salmonella enterica subsp. enterica serovar Choleraesuis]